MRGEEGDDLKDLPDHYFLDYLAASTSVLAAFSDIYGLQPRRWAYALMSWSWRPLWLQSRLFAELRSGDQDVLFKLSTSPVPQLVHATLATGRNDYQVIRLWPHREAAVSQFCERFVEALLKQRGIHESPLELFGNSVVFGQSDLHEYERGSRTWRLLRDWASVDEGFRQLLLDSNLDPTDPTTVTIDIRDALLRKAKPLVYYRHEMLKPDVAGRIVPRSRKALVMYSGLEAIYDVSDGNPRWLLVIIDELLRRRRRLPARAGLPERYQAQVLQHVSEQYAALIRALPDSVATFRGREVTLFDLLERVASSLQSNLLERRFSLDPPGSFIVDEDVPDELIPLVREAIYEGALILVDPTDDALDQQIVGKRFRITYLLAPVFRLPLRLYKAVKLSRLLDRWAIDRDPAASQEIQPPIQERLPFEDV